MRPTFRKLEVKDIGTLERLVAENADGVEAGLKVVDSRLQLGQTSVDLVGLDSKGSLVLIALDFSADDGLLLRVMDAYSWCLEYPDTLRRLYPMAQASSRPPRILFVVEKMTDAFLRRIKQLSFLEIDCFEFRHLEVNGAAVVYFDLVERLRKSVVETITEVSAPAPAPAVAPVVVESRVAPVTEPRLEGPVAQVVEPKKPVLAWAGRVESREPVSEPKPVDPPQAVVAPARPEPAAVVAAEPVAVEPAPVAVPEPQPVAPVESVAPVVAVQSEPVVPVVAVQSEPVAPVVAVQSAPTPAAEPPSVVVELKAVPAPEPAAMPVERPLQLEAIEATSTLAHTNGHSHAVPESVVAPAIEAAPYVAPVEETIPATPAIVAAPAPAPAPAPVQIPPVWAKPGAQPSGTRPQFFAQTTKGSTPVEAPAMVAAVAAAAEPATQPAASKVGLVDDRPELESLSFPKDGLSRQWLEFLSQLGATK
jgi:hypothetical protein